MSDTTGGSVCLAGATNDKAVLVPRHVAISLGHALDHAVHVHKQGPLLGDGDGHSSPVILADHLLHSAVGAPETDVEVLAHGCDENVVAFVHDDATFLGKLVCVEPEGDAVACVLLGLGAPLGRVQAKGAGVDGEAALELELVTLHVRLLENSASCATGETVQDVDHTLLASGSARARATSASVGKLLGGGGLEANLLDRRLLLGDAPAGASELRAGQLLELADRGDPGTFVQIGLLLELLGRRLLEEHRGAAAGVTEHVALRARDSEATLPPTVDPPAVVAAPRVVISAKTPHTAAGRPLPRSVDVDVQVSPESPASTLHGNVHHLTPMSVPEQHVVVVTTVNDEARAHSLPPAPRRRGALAVHKDSGEAPGLVRHNDCMATANSDALVESRTPGGTGLAVLGLNLEVLAVLGEHKLSSVLEVVRDLVKGAVMRVADGVTRQARTTRRAG
mmetsp:Transcript_20967/g.31984  ORF Transcript_20967/g.31984 Transcript_20967/m.31984 type:complete len:451 (-) Transcript_20967:1399-2751(-)